MPARGRGRLVVNLTTLDAHVSGFDDTVIETVEVSQARESGTRQR